MSDERDSEDMGDVSRPTVSGFSFISGGGERSESEEVDTPKNFMESLSPEEVAELKAQSNAVDDDKDDDDISDDNRESTSGFGFLGGIKEDSASEKSSDEKQEIGGSGFDFMTPSSNKPDHVAEHVAESEKLSKQIKSEGTSSPAITSGNLNDSINSPSRSQTSSTSPAIREVKLASSSTVAHKVVRTFNTNSQTLFLRRSLI